MFNYIKFLFDAKVVQFQDTKDCYHVRLPEYHYVKYNTNIWICAHPRDSTGICYDRL